MLLPKQMGMPLARDEACPCFLVGDGRTRFGIWTFAAVTSTRLLPIYHTIRTKWTVLYKETVPLSFVNVPARIRLSAARDGNARVVMDGADKGVLTCMQRVSGGTEGAPSVVRFNRAPAQVNLLHMGK